MKRTLFASVMIACTMTGCAYDPYYDPAYYDEPSRVSRGPYDDPLYSGAPVYRDSYGRPIYPGPVVRRDPRDDYGYGRPERPKRRMVIEDAQYESVNGQRIDANRYVRDECHGENNCDVKASNKIFGDPDVGARKDLIVRYRCGRGPSRTVRVPEKSEQDIKC